ncbi:MAG: hypothetical protein J6C29_04685 [Clostridia bacterium]|nr:hypothetical protein [Clostridia bacterium]
MAKHYEVDEAKKVIYADILALSAKEEAEVEKFVKFGFTVENKVAKKVAVKRLDEPFILDYLKDDTAALDEYKAAKNAPALDEDGKEKKTSTGKIKTQGFNAARNWFAKTYPKDVKEAAAAIKTAGLEKKLKSAYEDYAKKNADVKNAMTKDEYTKDFYWKKVFVKTENKKAE